MPRSTAISARIIAPAEKADNVFFVEGPASNWIILRDGKDFTLIDSGYRSDTSLVLDSIASLGLNPKCAAAVLVTHGHVDHTGAAEMFSASYGTPVLSSSSERGHLVGSEKFQVASYKIIARAWQPRVFKWMIHVIKSGGATGIPVPQARVFEPEELAQLPGHPVAVSTPGHTPGHTAFHLPGTRAVVTGDALITGHGISVKRGPQLLHPMFDHDTTAAHQSLPTLANIDAQLILPGHGPAIAMDIRHAVSGALSA